MAISLLRFANTIGIEKSYTETLIDEVCVKFIDTFLDYIDKLPNEIKGLPFHRGWYSKNTLENIFKKYYEQRVSYIKNKLIGNEIIIKKGESEDDFLGLERGEQ